MAYVWLARRVATITKYLVLLVAVPRERDGRGAPSLPQIVVVVTASRGGGGNLNEIVSVQPVINLRDSL